MKNKALSTILIGTLILGCLANTGCTSHSKREAVTITEDTPWYTNEYTDILNNNALEDNQSHVDDYIGKLNGEYVFARNIHTLKEGASLSEGTPYTDTNEDYIIFYDPDTGETRQIDILEQAEAKGLISNDTLDLTISNVAINGDINFDLEVMEGLYEDFSNYTITVDPVTGEFTDVSKKTAEDDFYMDYELYMSGQTSLKDGRLLRTGLVYYNDIMTLVLRTTTDSGQEFDCKLEDIYPTSGVYDIFAPIYKSDSDILIKLKTYGEEDSKWIEMDLAGGTVTPVTEDMSYLDGIDLNNVSYSEDFGNIVIGNDGIVKIDAANGTAEDIFSFDWCNLNRSAIKNLVFLGMDDGRIFLFDQTPAIGFDYNVNYKNELVTLTKCDTNPNVGKTILTVASFNEPSDAVMQAICDFNESNTEYFVKYIDDYDLKGYGNIYADTGYIAALDPDMDMEMQYFMEEQSEADINDFYMEAGSNLSNRIMVDLISGEGPDIILDSIGHSELNNSEYLLDLSGYMPKDLSPYFGNVIEAAFTDGHLYNVPLVFGIQGIVTDKENISEGQTGFTFDQYRAFVEDVCGGRDPMAMTRLNFFSSVLASMDEDYFDGKNVSYDTEAFRTLAEYALTSVSENAARNTSSKAEYFEWNDILGSLDMRIGDTATILGVPSINGMGPAINCSCSAAVYAGTSSPDGCWAFIETLMSTDIQTQMASGGFPINVEAFETAASSSISSYRNYYEYMQENAGSGMVSRLGIADIDESIIPEYEEIIRSADRIVAYDAPVMKVVREEIQAYFAEDKTLDEVIELINNRAQTFYDERG